MEINTIQGIVICLLTVIIVSAAYGLGYVVGRDSKKI